MTVITCDLCKKPIQDAHRDVNYITFRNKDICWTCKKKFERDLEDEYDEIRPYRLMNYYKSYWNGLKKGSR